MATRSVLRLAAAIARDLEAGYRDYLEACESYRRDGYRPAHCEHGTSLWTEWDNICGPCEDGLTMSDGLFRRQHALDQAKRRDAKVREIAESAAALKRLVPDLDLEPVWAEVTRLMTP